MGLRRRVGAQVLLADDPLHPVDLLRLVAAPDEDLADLLGVLGLDAVRQRRYPARPVGVVGAGHASSDGGGAAGPASSCASSASGSRRCTHAVIISAWACSLGALDAVDDQHVRIVGVGLVDRGNPPRTMGAGEGRRHRDGAERKE